MIAFIQKVSSIKKIEYNCKYYSLKINLIFNLRILYIILNKLFQHFFISFFKHNIEKSFRIILYLILGLYILLLLKKE